MAYKQTSAVYTGDNVIVATPPSYLALVSQSRPDDSATLLATSSLYSPRSRDACNILLSKKEAGISFVKVCFNLDYI